MMKYEGWCSKCELHERGNTIGCKMRREDFVPFGTPYIRWCRGLLVLQNSLTIIIFMLCLVSPNSMAVIPIVINQGRNGYGMTLRPIRVYIGDSNNYRIHHIVQVCWLLINFFYLKHIFNCRIWIEKVKHGKQA